MELIIAFCDSVDTTKPALAVQRLALLERLVADPATNSSYACASMTPHIVRWLRPHLGKSEVNAVSEINAKPAQMHSARVIFLENLYQCLLILGGLLHGVQLGMSGSAKSGMDVSQAYVDALEYLMAPIPLLLSSRTETSSSAYTESVRQHPTHSRKGAFWQTPHLHSNAHRFDSSHSESRWHRSADTSLLANLQGRICMVVIAIVKCSSTEILRDFFDDEVEIKGPQHGANMLTGLFTLLSDCLQGDVYPKDWASIASLSHTASASLAERIQPFLTARYLYSREARTPLDLKLWNSYLQLTLRLLTSPVLAIENFLPAKQRTTWRLFGDLRGRGSRVLIQAWNALGTGSAGSIFEAPQVGFSGLIPQVVELCLSHHDDMRQAGVVVLASLVLAEYQCAMWSYITTVADIFDRQNLLEPNLRRERRHGEIGSFVLPEEGR